jgi:hypothetical protein
MERVMDWVGFRLGLATRAPRQSEVAPWWSHGWFGTDFIRTDGLALSGGIAGCPSWWSVRLPGERREPEVGPPLSSKEPPFAFVDRRYLLARPPVRAGQIWVFESEPGEPEPTVFLVTISGTHSFDWVDREHVVRADVERVDRTLQGWALVAGPGAPWCGLSVSVEP